MINLVYLNRRTHERDGIMRLCRRVGTDMRRDKDIAREHISLLLHIKKLYGNGERRKRTISIRHVPNHFWSGSQPTETSQNTKRRCVSARRLSVASGNADLEHMRNSSRTSQRIGLGIDLWVDRPKIIHNGSSIYAAIVEEIINVNDLLDQHSAVPSFQLL